MLTGSGFRDTSPQAESLPSASKRQVKPHKPPDWLDVVRGRGIEAVMSAYLDVLEDRVDPGAAHVLSLR